MDSEKRVVMGVCGLWPVAEPSQSTRRNASRRKTEGGERVCKLLEDDALGTGKEPLINALPGLTKQHEKRNSNQ